MEKIELKTKQLPDGQTLVYTADPSVLLHHIPPLPYGSTGVANMAWMKAEQQVGRNYTDREIKDGWPLAIEPHRLACLQFPPGNEQSDFNAMLVADCERGRLRCTSFERHDYEFLRNGGRELIEVWTDYAVTAPNFAAWLARQGMEPSQHIAAWFKACKVSTAPAPQPAPQPAAASGKLWTPEKLAEVQAYRALHGTKATAAHYNVSEQRVRQLLPGDKPKAKGYGAFTHHHK